MTLSGSDDIVEVMAGAPETAFWSSERRKLMASGLMNFSVVALSAAFISDTFSGLSVALRVSSVALGVVAVVAAIIVCPESSGEEAD